MLISRRSALDSAWEIIFSSQAEDSDIDELRVLFRDENYVDTRQFSILHKVVLGLSNCYIEDVLATSAD